MDQGLATLIAAILAAAASIATSLSTRASEVRMANRKTIEAALEELQECIHQLIATSNILLKNRTEKSRSNWRGKAENAKTDPKKA